MQSLTVPGKLEFLKTIRQFILASAREYGLDERRAYRLSLAVDEIATNIITYGYDASGATGTIEIYALASDNCLEIVLEDTSAPFAPQPGNQLNDLKTPGEARNIGGLGIFLAGQNVDDLRYEYVDGRNRNIFIMRNSSP